MLQHISQKKEKLIVIFTMNTINHCQIAFYLFARGIITLYDIVTASGYHLASLSIKNRRD